MTKLEEVARAIYLKRNGVGCRPWHRLEKAHREPYLMDARAAVEAMREPDDRMVAAIHDADFTAIGPAPGWTAGIDSILSDPPRSTEMT